MGYTYDQRKRPQGLQNTGPERTRAPGPGHNALMPGTAVPQSGPTFDLDAAMQARMASTFGDLSAVWNYTPPVREQAPLQTGPYTGPVTHAVSNASPLPLGGRSHAGQEGLRGDEKLGPGLHRRRIGVRQTGGREL